MRFTFFLIFSVGAAALAGCGGQALGSDDSSGDDASYGRGPDGGGTDGNGFVDPHCPDSGSPPTVNQCSVFAQDCPLPDEGCYPSAIPPSGPCESEVYGSFCLEVGSGKQGAPCDNTAGCAPGFVCLITGATTQCARLCDFQSHTCTDGFVCEPIDVPGFSACL